MTYEEALKELKHEIDMLPKEPPSDFVVNENVWFKEHEKIIDAHNRAIEALEKQIPQKPLRGYTCKANNDSWRSCPVCHARQWNTHKYCSQCGQALDWGE